MGQAWLATRARRGRRKPTFTLVRTHLIVPRGGDVTSHEPAECAHIGRDLPDLILRNFSAERRHAVRPAFADAGGDVFDRAAVDPHVVHQRRARTPTPVSMTTAAVVPSVQLLALAYVKRVFLVLAAGTGFVFSRRARSRRVGGQCNFLAATAQYRAAAQRPVLPLASGQQCRLQQYGH